MNIDPKFILCAYADVYVSLVMQEHGEGGFLELKFVDYYTYTILPRSYRLKLTVSQNLSFSAKQMS